VKLPLALRGTEAMVAPSAMSGTAWLGWCGVLGLEGLKALTNLSVSTTVPVLALGIQGDTDEAADDWPRARPCVAYRRRSFGEPPIFAGPFTWKPASRGHCGSRALSPPVAGTLRCAGSAAPAGPGYPPIQGGRRRERWASRIPSLPSAPRETCRPAVRTRTARPH
jgi:hypothetical protein